MKIVFLLGNGFDSAHNAPTSFIDFSEWLFFEKILTDLENYIKERKESEFFNDTILNKDENAVFPESDYDGCSKSTLHGLFTHPKEKQVEMIKRNIEFLYGHLSNQLLKILYEEKSEHWFNIEETFFRLLKNDFLKLKNNPNDKKNFLPFIVKLNEDFNKIKIHLKTISI